LNPSSRYSLSLKNHFNTYGLINCVNFGTVDDYTTFSNSLKTIDEHRKKLNQVATTKYKHLTDVRNLKKIISQMKRDISTSTKELKQNINLLKISENEIKYTPFRYLSAYTKYTGIDF
jgi:peptidoglycan hydrolase CwlO-like protein